MNVTLFLTVVAVLGWAALVWLDEVTVFLRKLASTADESIPELEFRKEVVAHASFYGAAVSAFIGLGNSWPGYAAAAFWFFGALTYARAITMKIVEAEELEKRAEHRRLAGTTRSIVRDELAKAGGFRTGRVEEKGDKPYTGANGNAT